MKTRKIVGVVAGVSLAIAMGVAGVGVAASTPSKVTIKQKGGQQMVPNRYIKDLLRWDRDVYQVRSGGTLHVVDSIVTEGPHTFTVVKKTDLPKTAAQAFNCKACNKLVQAHGADPNTNAPPQHPYLDDGAPSDGLPNVDKPGDSALVGPGKKGESIDLKVTAKKGSTLYFMCLIHPWMQGKVIVR